MEFAALVCPVNMEVVAGWFTTERVNDLPPSTRLRPPVRRFFNNEVVARFDARYLSSRPYLKRWKSRNVGSREYIVDVEFAAFVGPANMEFITSRLASLRIHDLPPGAWFRIPV